jgi:hypothetical protein
MSKELSALLPQAGQLSKTGWTLPTNLTESEWKEAGAALAKVEGAMNWWLGDWWAFGEHGYGDRKALVEKEDWEGPDFKTCANASSVCKTFTTSRRRELVPFGHHAEVAGLPPADADSVLDWCESVLNETGRLPTRVALRDKVKQIKAWLAQGWTQTQLERRQLVEKGVTVVASMRNDDSGKPIDNALIAWADQAGIMVKIDRNTDWGNPFETPADGSRDEVCDNYAQHYLPYKPSLLKKVPNLKGKVLVCWCHPLRCHGDHLAELANQHL